MLKLIDEFVYRFAYPMEIVSEPPDDRHHGCWWLSPHFHIIESSVINIISLILFISLYQYQPKILKNPKILIKKYVILHRILKYLLIIDYGFHLFFKVMQPEGLRGLFWLLQPCLYNQQLLILLYIFPNKMNSRMLLHLLIMAVSTYQGVIFADVSDKTIYGEVAHHWIQHTLLYIIPHVYLLENIEIYYNYMNIYTFLSDCSVYAINHFFVMELAAIISGLNLNYLMIPPPNTPLDLFGKYYRSVNTLLQLIVMFPVFGWLIPYIICKIYIKIYPIKHE